jgi:hypothetical protein
VLATYTKTTNAIEANSAMHLPILVSKIHIGKQQVEKALKNKRAMQCHNRITDQQFRAL